MKSNPVIDVDGHVTMELVPNWTRYFAPADAKFLEALVLRPPSLRFWVTDGMTDAEIYEGLRSRLKGDGGWDPEVRLRDMDTDGIDVAVLFGNEISLNQEFYSPAICQGYNNWLHDYCNTDPDRLKAIALLPLGDVEAALTEMNRAVKELGCVGVLMKPSVEEKRSDDPSFLPIYAEAERLGIPVDFHISHGVRFDLQRKYGYDYIRSHAFGSPASMMLTMMDLSFGGVLERFQKLRVAFLEGAVGWVPYWLGRLDDEYGIRPNDVPGLKKLPSEYLTEDRIYYCCEPDEAHLAYALNVVGEDQIVWASDYPHADAIFPGALSAFMEQEGLSDRQRSKVLTDNALALMSGERKNGH